MLIPFNDIQLSKSVRDEKDQIVPFVHQVHYEDFCKRQDHKHYKGDGYIRVERPCWKTDCSAPITDPFLISQLEKLCNYFGLECSCLSSETCQLCCHIIGPSAYSCDQFLFINQKEKWDLKVILPLLPLMNFDKFSSF